MLRDALSKAKSLAAALEDTSPQNRRAVIARYRCSNCPWSKVVSKSCSTVTHWPFAYRQPQAQEMNATRSRRRSSCTRRGAEMLLITKDDCSSGARPPDLPLLKALARGHTWFAALASGRFKSVRELAKQEGLTDRYISRQVAFGFMAPKLVEAIVARRTAPLELLYRGLAGRPTPTLMASSV